MWEPGAFELVVKTALGARFLYWSTWIEVWALIASSSLRVLRGSRRYPCHPWERPRLSSRLPALASLALLSQAFGGLNKQMGELSFFSFFWHSFFFSVFFKSNNALFFQNIQLTGPTHASSPATVVVPSWVFLGVHYLSSVPWNLLDKSFTQKILQGCLDRDPRILILSETTAGMMRL